MLNVPMRVRTCWNSGAVLCKTGVRFVQVDKQVLNKKHSSQKTLTPFEAYTKSFPERVVDTLFRWEYNGTDDIDESDLFDVQGYVPHMPEIQEWAKNILLEKNIELPRKFVDQEFLAEIFIKYIIPFRNGKIDIVQAKIAALKVAKDHFSGSTRAFMFGEAPTSEEWYAAHVYSKCNNLTDEMVNRNRGYGDDIVTRKGRVTYEEYVESCALCADIGIAIGFLRRDAWWKFNHEQAAIAHYEQIDARQRGSARGGSANANRWDRLKKDCLKYLPQAYAEHGVKVLSGRADIVGKIIAEIAFRERPDDFVGPQGKPLAERWFVVVIEDFQANGAFGKAIEGLLSKV